MYQQWLARWDRENTFISSQRLLVDENGSENEKNNCQQLLSTTTVVGRTNY
jgi:hypothetical protein